jgi:hypothetical protein
VREGHGNNIFLRLTGIDKIPRHDRDVRKRPQANERGDSSFKTGRRVDDATLWRQPWQGELPPTT